MVIVAPSFSSPSSAFSASPSSTSTSTGTSAPSAGVCGLCGLALGVLELLKARLLRQVRLVSVVDDALVGKPTEGLAAGRLLQAAHLARPEQLGLRVSADDAELVLLERPRLVLHVLDLPHQRLVALRHLGRCCCGCCCCFDPVVTTAVTCACGQAYMRTANRDVTQQCCCRGHTSTCEIAPIFLARSLPLKLHMFLVVLRIKISILHVSRFNHQDKSIVLCFVVLRAVKGENQQKGS